MKTDRPKGILRCISGMAVIAILSLLFFAGNALACLGGCASGGGGLEPPEVPEGYHLTGPSLQGEVKIFPFPTGTHFDFKGSCGKTALVAFSVPIQPNGWVDFSKVSKPADLELVVDSALYFFPVTLADGSQLTLGDACWPLLGGTVFNVVGVGDLKKDEFEITAHVVVMPSSP